MPGDGIRLLALDGGGVRGLSSLMILRQLMVTIDRDSPPKPCEFFDMIGGTSTGGLIAIMLGRLNMTVDECIQAYISLAGKVFEKKRTWVKINGKIRGQFLATDFEQAVKGMIQDLGLDQEILLKNSADACCKVEETSDVVCLTSYRSSRGFEDLLDSTKTWQACRATSAATSFFDPIAIGPHGEKFVDGALRANNPVNVLWNQAQDIWGDRLLDDLKYLVSIGTGIPKLQPIHNDVLGIMKTLTELATETEWTAEQFRRNQYRLDKEGRYYRFNVDHGLEDIGLEEAKKKNEIAAATRRYLQLQVTFKQIKSWPFDAIEECTTSEILLTLKGVSPSETESLLERAKTQIGTSKARIQKSKGEQEKNDGILSLAKAAFIAFLYSLLSPLSWHVPLLLVLEQKLDENRFIMQEVIRSDRDIILELQREAEKGHDILDELKTLQDLMNSQKSPNQDPYSEPPDYEEFDNRAADFTTVSTKSHGHEVIEVKSENEADEDKEGEAEGETDEEDVGKFPQTPFQKEAAHFQEQIPILEERHRNLKEAVRELESKQAEIEAKVAKLENKLLEAQRKREEYEGKTVFGKIWAWIAWLARCGSED